MSRYTYIRFAQAYGDGAYSSCTYNCAEGASTGTGTPDTGGSLANTGVAIVGVVTLACLLLLIAVVVRVWRKPRKTAAPVPQEAATEAEEAAEAARRPGDPL